MSVIATILSAAGAAGEHAVKEAAKSETPFFVAGGVWAAFAIAISVFGFKRPDFPGNSVAARGVMIASIVLMLGATSMAVYVSG
jgi:hypothetical protein